jgi:hypothetical protein
MLGEATLLIWAPVAALVAVVSNVGPIVIDWEEAEGLE